MKLILQMVILVLGNASSHKFQVKYCVGSGGYFGECSDIRHCKDRSFSFSGSCGFDRICCKTSLQRDREKDTKGKESRLSKPNLQISTCGKSVLNQIDSNEAKVKKNIAKPGHFPWMVSFVYEKSGTVSNFCGGVLISPKHVLTAGHCFVGVDHDDLRERVGVRVGMSDISQQGGNQPNIQTFQVHPQFRNTTGILDQPVHDIALITLDREISRSSTVGQICLPEKGRSKKRIVKSVIAGWGATSSDKQESVDQLRYGQVELVPSVECQRRYNNWGVSRVRIDKEMICAGGKQVDACAGDSGAPLMVQQNDLIWVVAGLVSFGPARCGSDVPGVYVKVKAYMPWISRTMGKTR